MTQPQTPDEMRHLLMENSGQALEAWQVMLDMFEGWVFITKAMGWTDAQAREIVAPQILRMLDPS